MINVTDKAAGEIKRVFQAQGAPEGTGIRVAVQGGGCSGLSYKIDIETAERTGDKVFESNGVKIFIDMKSFIYLNGTTLDFSDGLSGRGFVFTNPNAKGACGCGQSFNV